MLFIAEIGMNHNGSLELCYELIKRAKESGASIAKFQLGWKSNPGELNHFDEDGLRMLERWCAYFEIEFMASIITEQAYETAKRLNFRRYKIASRTVKDRPELVERILDEGKETIISLGMWEGAGLPFPGRSNVRYLWCKSKYPASPWDLTDLPKSFLDGPYAGYSDHSVGIEVPLMAIARGARIIEKHLTLDKSDRTIRDHVLSATPDEFRMLTTLGTNIARNVQLGV